MPSTVARKTLLAPVVAWASRLRFPTLFGLTLGLFVVDLVVPDLVPLADELLLGLLTAVLASLRRTRKGEGDEGADLEG